MMFPFRKYGEVIIVVPCDYFYQDSFPTVETCGAQAVQVYAFLRKNKISPAGCFYIPSLK